MSQALVRRALETALNTWATSASVSVAWENVEFSPAPGTAYVRAFMLPAETQQGFVAGNHRQYLGVFQVTLCMPEGTGPAAADALVSSLDAAFTTTAPLTAGGVSVWIIKPMSPGPKLPEPGLYAIPVSCTYTAHVVT